MSILRRWIEYFTAGVPNPNFKSQRPIKSGVLKSSFRGEAMDSEFWYVESAAYLSMESMEPPTVTKFFYDSGHRSQRLDF